MESTPETALFWEALEAGRLVSRRCSGCGTRHHPYPRQICPQCGSKDGHFEDVGSSGELISFTVVERAPHGLADFPSPYVLALVDLEGFHILGLVDAADHAALRIGMAMAFRPARIGGRAVPGFVPADISSEGT
jgi:uncharacterized OB-fold protein